jgi:hypothetical protein
MSVIRRSIAKHMVVSKQTSPHVTTVMEADLMRVVQARERLKGEFERQGVRLTFTPFFVQAIVAVEGRAGGKQQLYRGWAAGAPPRSRGHGSGNRGRPDCAGDSGRG